MWAIILQGFTEQDKMHFLQSLVFLNTLTEDKYTQQRWDRIQETPEWEQQSPRRILLLFTTKYSQVFFPQTNGPYCFTKIYKDAQEQMSSYDDIKVFKSKTFSTSLLFLL